MPHRHPLRRHVKIWLSDNPDVFLNIENRLRLIRMRVTNRKDIIHLVYEPNLLSEQAQQNLLVFCQRHEITPINIRKDVVPDLKTELEKKLFSIYEDEINHLNEGGNMGVASDVLRWLYSVYSLGVYTDFDVLVNTDNLPEFMMLEGDILVGLGSVQWYEGIALVITNNDTISVAETISEERIQAIQNALYQNCMKQDEENIFRTTYAGLESKLERLNVPHQTSKILRQKEYQLLRFIGKQIVGKTSRELRQSIMELTNSNLSFSQYLLKSEPNLDQCSEQELIAKAAHQQRESFRRGSNSDSESHYLAYDDEQLLETLRKSTRLYYLQWITTHTTGPLAVKRALFDKGFYWHKELPAEVAPYSFQHYGLRQHFFSKNQYPLYMTIQQYNAEKLEGDASWLIEGKKMIAEREHTMNDACVTLQRAYRHRLWKINLPKHPHGLPQESKGLWGVSNP